jgi:hypothetical protein
MALVSRVAAPWALALVVLASPAAAGPPGQWTQVTNLNANGSTGDRIAVARSGNGVLNVLWKNGNSVVNSQVSADAQNVGGPHTVFTYPNGVGGVGLLTLPGGALRAFFSGLAPGDPHDQGLSTATSADGVSWAVQPTLASDDRPGMRRNIYSVNGIGTTLFSNGTPLSIWGDPAPAGYHVGTSDQTPDVSYGSAPATVGSPNAATDSATGQVAIGWNDIGVGRTIVRFVQPTVNPWFPPGPTINAPGGQAADAVVQVGMTGRSGGTPGIFLAYQHGTNFFAARPAVWRIGAPNPILLSGKARARFPGVTAGPNGRLWAFWAEQPTTEWQIHVRRSNTDATGFGAPVVIKPPAGTEQVWGLEGLGDPAGGCDALDLVAHVTRSGDATANYHQRLLPGITLKKKVLNKRRGRKAKVRFKTFDAGEPLNTTIKFGRKRATTGDDGKVKMKAKRKKHRARKVKATARRPCYTAAKKRVKIKKRRRPRR